MERPTITMSNLFAQLGQAGDDEAIDQFIHQHSPMASGLRLDEAAFWSPSQSAFLSEAIQDDAEWANVVEALNTRLHMGKHIDRHTFHLALRTPSYWRSYSKH